MAECYVSCMYNQKCETKRDASNWKNTVVYGEQSADEIRLFDKHWKIFLRSINRKTTNKSRN